MLKIEIKGKDLQELKSNVKGLYDSWFKETQLVFEPVSYKESQSTKKITTKKIKPSAQVDIEELIEEKSKQADTEESLTKDLIRTRKTPTNNQTVTHDSVKKLAQDKIAAGVIDRVKVKAEVKTLGGSQISDLDINALSKLNDFLIAA